MSSGPAPGLPTPTNIVRPHKPGESLALRCKRAKRAGLKPRAYNGQKKNGHDPDPARTSFIVRLHNQTKERAELGFEGLGEQDNDGFSAGAGEGDFQVTGVFDFTAKFAMLIGDGFDDAAAAI